MSQLSPVKINAVTFPHHSFCLQVCHSWQLQQRCQDLVLNLLIGLFFPPVNWHEITAGDNRTEELSVRWERGGEREARGAWCAHQVIWVTAWEKLFNPLSDCCRNEFTFPPLHHYWQDSKSSLCFLCSQGEAGVGRSMFLLSLSFSYRSQYSVVWL